MSVTSAQAVFQPAHAASASAPDDLARRFSATIVEPATEDREEMRILPRPIHRYASPEAGVIDGAVFGLMTSGTNPGALVMLELRRSGSANPVWQYGIAGMTACAITVTLDSKEVWSKHFSKGPAPFDNWVFRWESPGRATDAVP